MEWDRLIADLLRWDAWDTALWINAVAALWLALVLGAVLRPPGGKGDGEPGMRPHPRDRADG